MHRPLVLLTTTLVSIAILPFAGQAQDLRITVENAQPEGGFFFTPVWLGLHDGGFDLFDGGSAASSELATLAETGNPGPLGSLFTSSTNGDGTARVETVIAAPGGFEGAPVFEPGEIVSADLTVSDPLSNRYLSIASMVIPSNDAFFGNGDATMWEIWQADGTFTGPIELVITGSGIYDAGSEMNDAMGAAFSALGGTDTDEQGTVGPHPGLDNFLNTGTASGATVTQALGRDDVLARISIQAIPEPSTGLLALSCLAAGLLASRRRR